MNLRKVAAAGVILTAIMVFSLPAAPARAETHPQRVEKAISQAISGHADQLESTFKSDLPKNERTRLTSKKDALLAMLELGALHQMVGAFEESRRWFTLADRAAGEIDGQAVVSTKRSGGKVKASLVSEAAKQYTGAMYERVLSRTLNALNYVFDGDIDGALVEIRKARDYHEQVRDKIAKKVEKAEEKESREQNQSVIEEDFGEMRQAVADVRSSYENAFTYFLSALLNVAEGDPANLNDAWVAIEKSKELAPQNSTIASLHTDVERLQLGANGSTAETSTPVGQAEVTVVYFAGFVPRKSETSVAVFGSGGAVQSSAVSTYDQFDLDEPDLSIRCGGHDYTAELAVPVGKLAMKAHSDEIPGVIGRTALRVAAKKAVQKQAGKKLGLLGRLAGAIATNATENADLRAWYSLPAEIQIARVPLPAGTHRLALDAKGLSGSAEMTLEPGDRYLVLARDLGETLNVYGTNLSSPMTLAMEGR